MSVLVSATLFYTMTNTLLWDLPGDVLAAPASALCGWKGVDSLSRVDQRFMKIFFKQSDLITQRRLYLSDLK